MPLNQILRKNTHVLFAISMIQDQNPDAQTKSEFSEMVNDVINTDTIDHVTLCLADNLQRFRFMINEGLSEEEAIKHCESLSEKWHQDNSETIKKLEKSKKLSILTWKEFLNWPMYAMTIKGIEDLYKENKEFRNDVDGRVKIALKDIKHDAKISYNMQQTALLRRYLFEECAFQKFGSLMKFEYEIYKNPHCKAMRRIKNNSEFVACGYMIEVYFTQFNSSLKKQQPIEKDSFSPVFSKSSPKYYAPPVEISVPVKIAEFIEKTFQMLPIKEQEKACQELIKFTSQNILPLCYVSHENDVKI